MASDRTAEERAFVRGWRLAGARLEELRRERLRSVDLALHIKSLDGAFRAALAGPPRTTSGLVEQQALFSRMRRAGSASSGE